MNSKKLLENLEKISRFFGPVTEEKKSEEEFEYFEALQLYKSKLPLLFEKDNIEKRNLLFEIADLIILDMRENKTVFDESYLKLLKKYQFYFFSKLEVFESTVNKSFIVLKRIEAGYYV